jgi:hypothetical protein
MLVTLERYRSEAGATLSESERQTVDELLSTARLLVGRVEVQVNEPGATIAVDDESIGTSPLPEPFYADQGARRIRVTKPGFKEVTRTEQVAGGSELNLRIDLKRELHRGTLVVEAGPHDIILIDGKRVGQGRWTGEVASGRHSVRVTAPDRVPHQEEVTVDDEKRRRVAVKLEPAARGGSSAMWWWIGGGAAVAAGLIVGGYVLLKPDDPAPTPGYVGTVQLSIGPGGARFGAAPAGGRWP